MNPKKLSGAELVDFATNAATGVANGKVTGLLPAQNTAISDAIIAAAADLAAKDLGLVESRTLFEQAMDDRNLAFDTLQKQIADLKATMRAVNSPSGEFEVIGFDAPDTIRSMTVPQTPTHLVATATVSGVNDLKWTGHNANKSVIYVIEAKIGDTAPYVIVGTCTTQKYRHMGTTAGEFYQYRVRAQASRGLVSDWSNLAVVYGI